MGYFQIFRVDEFGLWHDTGCRFKNRQILSWSALLVRTLFENDSNYVLNRMLIEFENVTNPGDPVVVTDVDPTDINYFSALSASATRDYLRVPLLGSPVVDIASGYESVIPSGLGNRAVVRAQTAGSVGVHGKTFSSAANSVVCGLALAACPVDNDPSRDVLFCRAVLDSSKQIPKSAASQIGFTYSWSPMLSGDSGGGGNGGGGSGSTGDLDILDLLVPFPPFSG